jgi:hypothetical protein
MCFLQLMDEDGIVPKHVHQAIAQRHKELGEGAE